MVLQPVSVINCGNNTLHWDAKREAKHIKARQDSGKEARLLITGGAGVIKCSENSILSKRGKKFQEAQKAKNFQHVIRKTIKEIQQKNEQGLEAQRLKEEQAKQQRERVKPKNVANASSRIFGDVNKPTRRTSDPSTSDVSAVRVSLSPSDDSGGGGSSESNVSSITSITKQNSLPSTNFVQKNKSIASMSGHRPDSIAENKTCHRHSSFGKIPSYIKNRKAQAAEAEKLLALQKENDCPIGMVLMPDAERIETLHQLKETNKQLKYQLSHLPIANRTMRTEAKREQLERELLENEQSQVIFTRPKVYVLIEDL